MGTLPGRVQDLLHLSGIGLGLRKAVLAPLLLGALAAPAGAFAQRPSGDDLAGGPPTGRLAAGSLLERWTLTWLSEGWEPRWIGSEPAAVAPWAVAPSDADTPEARYHVGLTAELLRLGTTLEHRVVRLDLFGRYPLRERISLLASVSSRVSESDAFGRPLTETPRSEAGALGISAVVRTPSSGSAGPTVTASVLGGWDGGSPGVWGRVSARGGSYDVSLGAWTTTARETRYFLPGDSLRDLGVQHEADGAEIAVALDLGAGSLRLRPEASWRAEIVEPSGELRSAAFLYTSLGGRTDAATVALAVDGGSRGVRAAYRERRMDMDSGITRSAISAGWLSYARFGFGAERIEGWAADAERRWTLSYQRDRTWGEVSVRVETWPFVDLWESVSVQAYRLDGEVAGRASTLTLDRTSLAGGWSWGVQGGRYEVRAARETWFVTSFGFGRTQEEEAEHSPDAVYFLGVEGARTIPVGESRLSLRLTAQLPVHQEGEEGTDPGPPPPEGEREVAGYLGIAMSWSW